MGYHGRATVHAFRAVASTLLNEMGFHHDWIERQLAHDERNKVRAAYNHALFLAERRRMMQHWADYLDGLTEGWKGHHVRRRGGTMKGRNENGRAPWGPPQSSQIAEFA